ncbi:MAG: peptide transporter, partial [Candidatus Rokuibacteriota bacterium]
MSETLPIRGFGGTPEEIERQWYEQVYTGRGDRMLQLTWRAVLMGSALGGVLSLTNLYIGLKAGWGFGVAITACILSYAIWTALHRARLVRTPMTILENNCMQSTASSAGSSTGGTLISAFAAYMLITGSTLPLPTLLAWVFFLAVLGVTMAIPMKRQMINVEQLRFPSGIAAAETLRALHSVGDKGMRSARALGWAGLIAAAGKLWADGLVLVSAKLAPWMIGTWIAGFNQRVFGPAWMGRTVMFSWEPMFIAAGAITGLHVCWSMLLGSVTAWMIFAPILQHRGVIEGAGYAAIVQWTLWGGVACMVASSLLSFAMQWRTALRAFTDLGAMFGVRGRNANDPVAAIEAPASWFVAGQIVGFVGLAWLGHRTLGMPYWETAVAVVLSFVLALVACRVTGETDTTPVGAMGKITQLTFGALRPGNTSVNLMS